MSRSALPIVIAVVAASCSKGGGEEARRKQIVDAINALPVVSLPSDKDLPAPCRDAQAPVHPGDKVACPMSDDARTKFRTTAVDELRQGLTAFVSACGARRGAVADKIAADDGYLRRVVDDATMVIVPKGRDDAFTLVQRDLRQAVRHAFATCFATEKLGQTELAWIKDERFPSLVTLDDDDLIAINGNATSKMAAALQVDPTAPPKSP